MTLGGIDLWLDGSDWSNDTTNGQSLHLVFLQERERAYVHVMWRLYKLRELAALLTQIDHSKLTFDAVYWNGNWSLYCSRKCSPNSSG